MFETERVRVRQLTSNDVDDMHAVYGDAGAMRWVDDGQPIGRDECARWIEVTLNNYRTRGYGMSALVHKELDRIVGFCGLVHPGGQHDAEIKYALHHEWWGKGIATEVARGMLIYGATTFNIPKIIATVAPANEASKRVLLKAGMRAAPDRPEGDGSITCVFEWFPDL